ncbi:COP9 signalosome complex subunit 12 [Pyrrhoderma noxium]|uniref:COP9 signalosome complex subunit 12 n=1 Tax=Pyrrhoderma noxium TaxID=2282107 RepID=A0A286UN49_9AGAM|nr:COP9 signalosome complex subunit 12 [Pyrrhoderma noxium]
MTLSFSEYLAMLGKALDSQEGANLAYLLRPTGPHSNDLVKAFRNPSRQTLSLYENALVLPWGEIAISYILVINHIAKKRYKEAFKEHSQLVSQFFRYFTTNTGWTLSALFAILRDLRDIAHDADLEGSEKPGTECTEEAARIITKAFTHCVTDRTSPVAESRKWGVYYVVGLVMKCYFRVERMHLSKNILRALEANKDIPPLSQYPKAHQVTYRYYIGLIAFLNEDYEKAEQELTLSFYGCHKDAHANQQRILSYLIPLRLLKGHLPSEELLERFPELSDVYSPFVNAIRNADIKAFDVALFKWEKWLIDHRVYWLFERTRELVMRGLFRKVWLIMDKSTRISLHMFHCAVRLVGIRVEMEEVECFIANMIYKGLIRGYISHERQMVVLASNGAFPRLADRKTPFMS